MMRAERAERAEAQNQNQKKQKSNASIKAAIDRPYSMVRYNENTMHAFCFTYCTYFTAF
jgi:hypothetical protein